MDRQEQRKRAFSQAFQRVNQPRQSDQNVQAAKRTLSFALCARGLNLQDNDQENKIPLDLDSKAAFNETPGTQIRHPPPVDFEYADPELYNYASWHETGGYGPRPEAEYEPGSSPPALLRDRYPRLPARQDSLPTPPIVRGQSMFGPSPYVRPDLKSSSADVVDSNLQAVMELSPMSNVPTAVGPLTPSALDFGHLTLSSQVHSLPSSLLCDGVPGGRATISVMPVSSLVRHFSEINPNEVVILFDKGRTLFKADKYPLCSASRFFAQSLDGPFLDHGLARCIRLRDDFPFAVTTMFHFFETGTYMFDKRAFAAHPLLTALDFHIHTYIVGSKYGVDAFRDCAIDAYVGIAEHELTLGFLATAGGQLSDVQMPMHGFPVMPPAETQPEGETMITPIDRFLNSLVLLWRNTKSRFDALREAVLELIKSFFGKLLRVPFFVTLLQELVGFGDDIVASLGDDGFEVKAFQVPQGARVSQTVRFDV